MPQLLNLRHLNAFAQAARRGTMGLAAEAVHLSQPATTQAIRKLEHILGASLFERRSFGLNVTDAGQKFYNRVEQAFAHLEDARRFLGGSIRPLEFIATTGQLRAITAVAEHQNYSLAARALGLSQPGVYRAVADFQRLCGKTLFRATASGLEPVAAAREVARCMALALREIDRSFEDVREVLGIVDGRVWLGCLPLARTELLPAALSQLYARFSSVKVRIADGSYEEQLHALRHGHIDIIIGALRDPAPTNDIVQEALFVDRLSLVVRPGHPLLDKPLDFKSLLDVEWIVPRKGTPTRAKFVELFGKRGMAIPERRMECSSLTVMRGLLQRSDRIGIISTAQIQYEVRAGLLRTLALGLPATDRPIGITTRKNWQPTIAMGSFIEIFRDVCRHPITRINEGVMSSG